MGLSSLATANSVTGFSSTGKARNCQPRRVTRQTQPMLCSVVMGWNTLPTLTLRVPPSISTTGTCFSDAPSEVFAFRYSMAWPPQLRLPLPQISAASTSPDLVISIVFTACSGLYKVYKACRRNLYLENLTLNLFSILQ